MNNQHTAVEPGMNHTTRTIAEQLDAAGFMALWASNKGGGFWIAGEGGYHSLTQCVELLAESGHDRSYRILNHRAVVPPMRKTIVWGNVTRYSTPDFSHAFEVQRNKNVRDEARRWTCEVYWNNRVITAGYAATRQGSIAQALERLQTTAYKMPFASYRMADVLSGQY